MESLVNIHVGTSGWDYHRWRSCFYPKDLSSEEFLGYYAHRLHSVEVNRSLHPCPEKETFVLWRNTVPAGFVFTIKASRYITHVKRLKDPETNLSQFLNAANSLNEKLGPILFQLPGGWQFNRERFYDFLESLPSGYRFAFEFHDPSWYNAQAYEAMTEMGVALCMLEIAGKTSPKNITADFIYIRLCVPRGGRKRKDATRMLTGWAGAISTWVEQGREIFCYLESDEEGYAVLDALRLQSMLNIG